jgi:hypothetical protein
VGAGQSICHCRFTNDTWAEHQDTWTTQPNVDPCTHHEAPERVSLGVGVPQSFSGQLISMFRSPTDVSRAQERARSLDLQAQA